jgi:hypothetical protein
MQPGQDIKKFFEQSAVILSFSQLDLLGNGEHCFDQNESSHESN